MKIIRYYQDIGYPEDMREHDGLGDWVKYEDVEPLLKRIEELEAEIKDLAMQYLFDTEQLGERIEELTSE